MCNLITTSQEETGRLAIGSEVHQRAAEVAILAAKCGESSCAYQLHVHVRDAAGEVSELWEELLQGLLLEAILDTAAVG